MALPGRTIPIMDDSPKEPDIASWSTMWQHPTVTSFTWMFQDSYDGSILDFWKTQLVGPFNHIVDLACGNGALAWICNDILNRDDATTVITGVDSANIDPFRALGRKKSDYPAVEFLGNTRTEELPFADHSIDLAVSQYGIEYSNLEKTIPEIARVLTPTGRIGLVLHDFDSIIVRESVRYLGDMQEMAEKVRLHELALPLVQLYEKCGINDEMRNRSDYQQLKQQIGRILKEKEPTFRQHPSNSPLARYIRTLGDATNMQKPLPIDERKILIQQARDGLIVEIRRLKQLAEAALSPAGFEKLAALVEAQGLTVTAKGTLKYNEGDNFGTILTAEKVAD